MKETTNYKLKTYDAADAPDLQTGYNASMTTIDSELKKVADAQSTGGYTLPAATADALGGVKIGSGVSVADDGTISVAASTPEFVTADSDNAVTVEMLSSLKVTAAGIVYYKAPTSA